jgi:hypothetical protein
MITVLIPILTNLFWLLLTVYYVYSLCKQLNFFQFKNYKFTKYNFWHIIIATLGYMVASWLLIGLPHLTNSINPPEEPKRTIGKIHAPEHVESNTESLQQKSERMIKESREQNEKAKEKFSNGSSK